MQLIIDGSTKETRQSHIYHLFPPQTTSYCELTTDKSIISVESTRQLLQRLNVTSPITRVVYIHEASALTHAAQNTLLKTLEEPPHNTHFVLSLNNHRILLPTIISRCQLTSLPSYPQATNHDLLKQIKTLMHQGTANRLSYLSQLSKDRETTIEWLDELFISIGNTLHTTTSPKGQLILSRVINLVSTTKNSLMQNGNITLVMGNFLLSLPHTK